MLRVVRDSFWDPFTDQRHRFEYRFREHLSFQAVMLSVVPVCLFIPRNDLWRRRANFPPAPGSLSMGSSRTIYITYMITIATKPAEQPLSLVFLKHLYIL